MNTKTIQIKRTLISVSNKDGLIEFAQGLYKLNAKIISTGGTYKKLTKAGIQARKIFDFTSFPEMMDGRVKTLHPIIHGGILGLRDEHAKIAEKNNIK